MKVSTYLAALVLVASLLTPSPVLLAADSNTAPSPPWTTDYEAARERAAAEGRLLLLNFTGSDWCPPCRMLDREILSTPRFVAFAEERLVLLYVDFPRRKALPEGLRAQNDRLAEEFGIESYPSIWIVAPDGTRLGRLGYMEGGPRTFIRAIQRLERRRGS